MTDRGFTIRDVLAKLGADLNLPPFLDGRKQLTPEELKKGRSIASLRIHIAWAIGRMKQYKILCGTLSLKMASVADQIVTVTAY